MPTLNYTTKIAVEKTAQEINMLLGRHGADRVVISYREGRPVAISFSAPGAHGMAAFTLPVNADAMLEVLIRQANRREIPRAFATPEQAERVAWRVIKDWLAAQLALIETSMVSLERIMLPYRHEGGPETPTLYERFIESGHKRIEA